MFYDQAEGRLNKFCCFGNLLVDFDVREGCRLPESWVYACDEQPDAVN